MVSVLPVLGEATTAVEPGDGALNDPALWLDDEAFGVIGAFDDLDHQATDRFDSAVVEHWPGISGISEQFAKERELSAQSGQHQDAAVPVLNIGTRHQRMQHQAKCIDQDVTLLSLDQLAGIEAMRVDARPPFSALFTLWLSITQAVRLASRSACSRHFT